MLFLKPVLLLTFTTLVMQSTGALPQSSVPQGVGTGELQRYIYEVDYPTWCGQAGQAAMQMRVKPSTDPTFLHSVMKANIQECADTQFAQQHAALWNTAVYGATAAALLAARNEPPDQALQDAVLARNWSAALVGYVRQPGAANPGPGRDIPTVYRTNALRMQNDALALISALQSGNSSAPAAGAPAPTASP